jgi:primosomal protein N' (replication factor Y)
VRPIDSILKRRFFTQEYWVLLERIAAYYQTPLIQVLKTALPPGLLARSQRRLRLCRDRIPPQLDIDTQLAPGVGQLLTALQQSTSGDYTWQYLRQRGLGSYRAIHQLVQLGWAESYLAPPQPPRAKQRQAISVICPDVAAREDLTNRQVDILKTLQRHGGELWLSDALQLCKTTSATLKRLATAGCVVIEPREVLRTAHGPHQVPDQPKPLTQDQARALETIHRQYQGSQFYCMGSPGLAKPRFICRPLPPGLNRGSRCWCWCQKLALPPS